MRTPKHYYTIEVEDMINEPSSFEIYQHENIWHEDIYEKVEMLNGFNMFLRKIDARVALQKIRKALRGMK